MQKVFTLDADFSIVGYETKLEKSNNVSLKDLTGELGNGIGLIANKQLLLNDAIINISNWSCCFWIKPTDILAARYLLIKNSFQIRVNTGGELQVTSNVYGWAWQNTGIVLSVDTWYFLVVRATKSGNAILSLNNGSSTSTKLAGSNQDSNLYLGYTGGGIIGQIDEVGFYSGIMSAGDETIYYNSGAGRYGTSADANLIVGYHLDEESGTIATDYSTNAKNATATSGVTWQAGKVYTPSTYASDSPQAKLIEAGQVYSIDAGAGYMLKPSAFADTEITDTGSSIKYRYIISNTGDYPESGWSEWKTQAEMDALASGGSLDGKRYLFLQAQFNSDGVTDATLSDAMVTYTVEVRTDYDELPVADEGSATETFSWIPDYSIPLKDQFKTRKHEFEAGYVQTSPEFVKTRREFELKFMSRSYAEKTQMLNFIEARKGGEEAFYYTPEDEVSAIKVYCDSEPVVVKKNPNIYDINLKFLECY